MNPLWRRAAPAPTPLSTKVAATTPAEKKAEHTLSSVGLGEAEVCHKYRWLSVLPIQLRLPVFNTLASNLINLSLSIDLNGDLDNVISITIINNDKFRKKRYRR